MRVQGGGKDDDVISLVQH